MKIAILCPGLGRTYRGYERFASELFETVRPAADVQLFRGAGSEGAGQSAIGGLGRDSIPVRLLAKLRYDVYTWEAAVFALKFRARASGFDILHYSEPSLNLAFTKLKAGERAGPRRLFSHALNMDAAHTLRCHHIHQASPEAYAEAAALGVPGDRMTLLPYGVHAASFRLPTEGGKAEARRKFGLPLDKPVVLSVAAVNRTHKRIDFLIESVHGLASKPHLVLAGALDDLDLLEHARRVLGPDNVSHLYVAPHEITSLYHASDIFVLASLVEGFGLGALEAQLSGLPVIVNDSPHFRWLLGEKGAWFVDMTNAGALSREIEATVRELDRVREEVAEKRTHQLERYDWSALLPLYLDMYRRTLAHPDTTIEQVLRG